MSTKNTLFDNPYINNIKKNMSKEDIKKYEEIGKAMYNTMDFEKGKPIGTEEPIENIKIQLRSGLHPSMLDEDEKKFMNEYGGKEWWKEWGYEKEDITEIKTLK